MMRGRRTLRYTPTTVPSAGDVRLLGFLQREFQAISLAMAPPNDLLVEVEEPKNPQVGQLRYADGAGWDPGSGEGVYVYTSTGWSKL